MASKISFDYNAFGDAMNADPNISVHDYSKNHGWNQRDDLAMHYKHSSYDYRTWHHDQTAFRSEAALLVSCKIDQRRGDLHHDDHIVLIAAFNRDKHIIMAQAGAQSLQHGGKGGHTDPIIVKLAKGHSPDAATDKDLADRFETALAKVIKDDISSSDSGLSHMVHVVKSNLLAMAKAVKLG